MPVIDDLLAANAKHAAVHRMGAPVAPRKKLAVVACMDARLDVFGALGLEPGDAHVIRNAGGAVTDDVLRSLVVSQQVLGTEAVMLIHHTECGLLGLDEAGVLAAVERTTGERPPMRLGGFGDLDEDVRKGLERVRSAPYLPHRDQVRGFVYDVTSGLLREIH
ncbi:MAG TPA: carbonic anhydrase [Candidatus Dormibacteraeota bacterium]